MNQNNNNNPNFKQEFIKRLIKFSLDIIKFCEKIRKDPNLRAIADQLIRSALSIGANIVEAKSSCSKREYLHYFQISLKSANESKYWLLLIRESSQEFRQEANKFLNEATEIANIIGSAVLTMKGKKKV